MKRIEAKIYFLNKEIKRKNKLITLSKYSNNIIGNDFGLNDDIIKLYKLNILLNNNSIVGKLVKLLNFF